MRKKKYIRLEELEVYKLSREISRVAWEVFNSLLCAIKARISTCFSNLARWLLCFSSKRRVLLLTLGMVGILVDIFVFPFTSDWVIFGLTVVWIGAVVGWRLEGRFSVAGALIFLLMCPFLLILKKESVAEKAAIWAYMFLVVGVVQQLIEIKKKPKGLVDFDRFVKAFWRGFVRARRELKEKNAEELAETTGSWLGRLSVDLENYLREIRKSGRLMRGLAWLVENIVENITWLLSFIFKFWFVISLLLGIALISSELGKELIFYHRFFEEQYLRQFWQRQGWLLIVFWLLSLGFFIWLLRRHWHSKVRQILIILLLVILWQGNGRIFQHTRAKFEFKPYILRVSPPIADQYRRVTIYGRNFRDLPFQGEVLLEGRRQRVVSWSDRQIIFETDPFLSRSGQLVVVNKYEGRGELKSNPVKFIYYNPQRATPEERKRFWEALKHRR